MAIVAGTFSGAGVSSTFQPLANSPFAVQLSGTFVAAPIYLMVSSGGSPFALMYESDGRTPLVLYSPGCRSVDVPYTAPGAVPPSYRLSCKSVASGTVAYGFGQ